MVAPGTKLPFLHLLLARVPSEPSQDEKVTSTEQERLLHKNKPNLGLGTVAVQAFVLTLTLNLEMHSVLVDNRMDFKVSNPQLLSTLNSSLFQPR